VLEEPIGQPGQRIGGGTPTAPAAAADVVATTRPGWVLAICFALTALNVMDRQVLAITASAIQAEFGLSDTQLGVLTGFAFVVMHATVGIPISWLADRTNRRNVIALGLVAWSGLTAATGLARGYAQIFAARVGVGIGEAVGSGPIQSLLSDYFPVGRRGWAIAVNGAGGNLGAFVALLLGGFLVDAVGWRATFFVFGAPGLVVAALLYWTVEEPRREGSPERSGSASRDDASRPASASTGLSFRESLGRFARLPSFWLLTFSAGFNQFTNYAFLFFLPTAMMRLYDLDASRAGSLLALCQAAPTFVGVLTSGWLVDRLAPRDTRWHLRVPAIASALAVPFAIAFLACEGLGPALALCVVASFFGTMWVATGNTAMQTMIDPAVRATAHASMIFFSSGLGLGLGPAFVGWASDAWAPRFGVDSLRYALIAAALVQVLGAAAHALAARRYEEDSRRARG